MHIHILYNFYFNSLHFSIFWGIFKERSVFYEFLCEGPSVLRKYKLTVVRGLKNMLVIEKMCGL